MVGERLRKLRKDKGMTQQELAGILGVRKAAVSIYETDKYDPSDPIKVAIAKHFDVSLDYLMGVIDDEVKCYSEARFVAMPENVTAEERELVRKFVAFVEFARS